ncbi:TonB-dependent receptor [Massilia sp. PAMC28688]|uniref:TonB-dependent receptor plug domain-containing protein n=1 Tax=Massilia sp. PAMC28688 TaxID=2861283 RepID=UPI001C62AF7D|nr:TonB-dependent receptor [Massilia sp. PAMC28688]QYF94746.1 TonB-dependent receptor [Massilia sp. PAMC28688]
MNITHRSIAIVLLASQPAAVWADDASGAAVPVVQVTGAQSDAEARRQFVAGKIIIGRKRIEESGVRKVEDMLRREPAVTVSSDGRIGLLNMPGYTQILLDGQAPVGRSPTELDLVSVEKIEIVKSSMAEYGPFGVAGTINIITRKTTRKTETEIAAGIETTGGEPKVTMDLSRNSSVQGSPLRYSFQLSAEAGSGLERSNISESIAVRGQSDQLRWHGQSDGKSRQEMLSGSMDVIWQRADDETLTLSPSIATMIDKNAARDIRLPASGVESADTAWDRIRLDMLRVPVRWESKLSSTSKADVSVMTAFIRSNSASSGIDAIAGARGSEWLSLDKRRGGSQALDMSYRTRLANGHNVKLGSTIRHMRQVIRHRYELDGARASAFDLLGARSAWRNRSFRVFVQDEWELSEKVDVNAGMSAQATDIQVSENRYQVRNESRILSPSLHLSRKIGKDDANHLRLSIARSFKEVEEDDLSAHPEIHPLAPCISAASCGPNSAATADKVGNAILRPERALGMTASYEHAIGAGSHVNVELYSRQIDDKMGKEIILLSVPWSADPRHVIRPANLGDARSLGLSVEMELALRDIAAEAPKLAIRGSAGIAESTVSNVPGPENKLDRQTPWNAKLGSSYSMEGFPITFDADASWAPSVWIRTSAVERIYVARVFTFEASAKWQMTPDRRLIVGMRSASPRTRHTIHQYITNDERVSRYDDSRRFSTIRVQFESSL